MEEVLLLGIKDREVCLTLNLIHHRDDPLLVYRAMVVDMSVFIGFTWFMSCAFFAPMFRAIHLFGMTAFLLASEDV